MQACSVHVRGVVQGVGFRPFVFRLARDHALAGWVLNRETGVEIHVEGAENKLHDFVRQLSASAPAAAVVASVKVCPTTPTGLSGFVIRASERAAAPSARISPDLPVCDDCLRELFDPVDPRCGYPYINCTNCGPRYSIVLSLPYDRGVTTMRAWPMDDLCARQYEDPEDRRFHAQPVSCANCGPRYSLALLNAGAVLPIKGIGGYHLSCDAHSAVAARNPETARAASMLNAGAILAIKGIGGYHLSCDAQHTPSVRALRERKFRKEKPFAVMARDIETARTLAHFSPAALELLTSAARPIVLAPATRTLEAVAPDTTELGVMLPYTPLHHLLFAAGAPATLVMTSANRSSEPIAYTDEDALATLAGIADGFLIGERPIARRVDDSVARAGRFGPVILRRSRGYAPGVVARLPHDRPLLALGADLKNAIAIAPSSEVIVSQHIGDLEHYSALQAFGETIDDLAAMYEAPAHTMLVAHDAHPQYASTRYACALAPPERRITIQHHRAHIASVLAEREEWDRRVLGFAFDGTGYGDDGAIWGGEIFEGSIRAGFTRVAHLRYAALPGGDAAARHPVQAAAGFLAQLDGVPDLTAAPFHFPDRYTAALRVLRSGVRTFQTTSVGRLFDTVAALLGFTRSVTYEGQAAMWLEQLARKAPLADSYPFTFDDAEIDFRPALRRILEDRMRGADPAVIARAFHRGLATSVRAIIAAHRCDAIALSGGVFQNELLLEDIHDLLDGSGVDILTNHAVPPNDGGICLGQIALAAFHHA